MNSAVGLFRLADSVLRGDTFWSGQRLALRRPKLGSLAAGIFVFGMFYGGVMGMYGGVSGPRVLQVAYSAIKVPILLGVTFLLSLPSFFVLNTLLGLRSDFSRVLQSLVATQTGLTVILAALAPFTAFWYISSGGYQLAILFNGGMFAVASLSAQWILRRDYIPLVRDNPKHRWMLRTWIMIYVFVGIQMGWVLRPFIGDPNQPVQFFRDGSWSNAYEFVLRLAWDVVTGKGR
jgi:hypothetical protein